MGNNSYTYTLAYPTSMGGAVFYVGKGSGYRINSHELEARNGITSVKCDIIRDIWEHGAQIVKTKVYDNISEEEAYQHEVELIRVYGLEALANRVSGIAGAPVGNKNRVGKGTGKGNHINLSMPYEEWEAFKCASDIKAGRVLNDEEHLEAWKQVNRLARQAFIKQYHGLSDEVLIL